jgi:MarR family transcriptional regulator, negative regulator of the multidrug operon emrRAB
MSGVDTDRNRLVNLLGVTALAAVDRLRELGASAPAALIHLDAHPGASVEELRAVLGISQPATVRAIDRLAGDELVVRRPGRDGRTLSLHPTAVGRAEAAALLRRRAEALGSLLDPLGDEERAALETALERVVAALADDRPAALRTCRQCDRVACTRDPGCPLQHTVP